MKLRNKKTGEIAVFGEGIVDLNQIGCKNVAEMIDTGWEDYEEPKEFYYITVDGYVTKSNALTKDFADDLISIGNYFKTREEAEKAVEKLKAWKRLKDKGFSFYGAEIFSEGLLEIDGILPALKGAHNAERLKIIDDLNVLFGGDE